MRRNAPGPASTKMRGVPSTSTMKLDPPLPNGRGPPEPSTTTSNAGCAGAARRQGGNRAATTKASAISVFMISSPCCLRNADVVRVPLLARWRQRAGDVALWEALQRFFLLRQGVHAPSSTNLVGNENAVVWLHRFLVDRARLVLRAKHLRMFDRPEIAVKRGGDATTRHSCLLSREMLRRARGQVAGYRTTR